MTKQVLFSLNIDAATDALQVDPEELSRVVRAVGDHLAAVGTQERGVVEFAVLDSFNEKIGNAVLTIDDQPPEEKTLSGFVAKAREGLEAFRTRIMEETGSAVELARDEAQEIHARGHYTEAFASMCAAIDKVEGAVANMRAVIDYAKSAEAAEARAAALSPQ
jgi:hypothetical protein